MYPFAADQTYCGFSLLDPNGVKHYFVFCAAICQGTSQSSYVFDRLLNPVLRHWRQSTQGASIIYVDDAPGAAPSRSRAQHTASVIVDTLTN